jgi:hypothetical protein
MNKKNSEIASPMVKKFSHQRHTKEDLGLKFEDLSRWNSWRWFGF